jgi:hypothetical protein
MTTYSLLGQKEQDEIHISYNAIAFAAAYLRRDDPSEDYSREMAARVAANLEETLRVLRTHLGPPIVSDD